MVTWIQMAEPRPPKEPPPDPPIREPNPEPPLPLPPDEPHDPAEPVVPGPDIIEPEPDLLPI
jgi:hypothetical protein